MKVKVIGTGSKGNGYALIADDEILLIECGVSEKEMLRAIDYQTGKVVGCLVSHGHLDHCSHVKGYMKYGIDIYCSDEVSSDVQTIYGEKTKQMLRMKKYQIGSFDVIAFRVPHSETECDGFLVKHKDIGALLFITDAEYCPYDFSKMGINHALIECNYSKDYLTFDESSTKTHHVLQGHMELETCKRLVQTIDDLSLRSIGLIHLSGVNGDSTRFRSEIKDLVDADVDVYVAEKQLERELSLGPF